MTDLETTVSVPPALAALPDESTLYLVDGSGFIFRAFHALPPLTRADGTPVGAVLGFTNMLLKLLAGKRAHAVAVIFDAARANFRNDIYPEYKANREAPPPELIPQFALVREATEAFNLPAIELEGYEADDLIATYARQAAEAGRQVVVVSSDKDLMQLVRDGVSLYDPMKDRPIGPDAVVEKFGVPPAQVVDVQALAGDSTDNVPGVPGIGVKTAAQLITQFGDLETLLARAGEIPQPKRRQALIDNAELARISRRLVLLDDRAPAPLPLDALNVRTPDHEKLIAFLRAQGFRSVITRVENDLYRDGGRPAPAPAPEPATTGPADPVIAPGTPPEAPAELVYELVTDEAVLAAWAARAIEAGVVAVDTETDGLTPAVAKLVGVSLATAAGHACYIPLGHVSPDAGPAGQLDLSGGAPAPAQIPTERALAILKPMLEDPSVLKVGHNIKFDLQLFARYGVTVAPLDDTMLISYVIDGGLRSHGMDELSRLHLGHETIAFSDVAGSGKAQITFDRVPLDAACRYAAEDADITLRLHQTLKPRLVPVLADMERAGVCIDAGVLASLSGEFAARLVELEAEIHRLAGHAFNVGSPKQLGEVLFDEMGLPGGRKGKTGAYGTGSEVLEPLAEQGIELAARVLDWRQLAKLKSTYTDTLQQQVMPETGRVHTAFAMAATTTGRLSSSDPNLQNIPIRSEEGRKIRRAFVAPPGSVLMSADYSQIELRLVAEIAGIAALQQAFREGIDIHALTASQVFGVPLADMTPDLRRKAKAINFGIIYGISGFGLGRQLGIPAGEANAFIRQYLERFHELGAYMERTKAFARRHGYVETLFGRRCPIAGVTERNPARRGFAERQAINAPIQGSAADIIKRAMIRVPPALEQAGLQARMLLQVHDELLFEVPEDEVEPTRALVREVMEKASTLSLPLVVDVGTGPNWAQAH